MTSKGKVHTLDSTCEAIVVFAVTMTHVACGERTCIGLREPSINWFTIRPFRASWPSRCLQYTSPGTCSLAVLLAMHFACVAAIHCSGFIGVKLKRKGSTQCRKAPALLVCTHERVLTLQLALKFVLLKSYCIAASTRSIVTAAVRNVEVAVAADEGMPPLTRVWPVEEGNELISVSLKKPMGITLAGVRLGSSLLSIS